jgi:hypothetical protein
MYESGKGLERDPELAFEWTLRAAKKGTLGAQYNAGLLHAGVRGGPLDVVEAYKWFRLAADKGYPGARQNLEFLGAAMTPGELNQAQSLARAWRPE